MSAPAFAYLPVDSYEAAVAALCEHGEDARILAGGQSLMPMLNLRLVRPSVLVDINAMDGVSPTVLPDGRLSLPAMTRHRIVLESPLVGAGWPLLAAAAGLVGNVRVRNRGTVGGSLAHGDPTAEVSCATMALGAEVVVLGSQGSRTIPVRELFVTYLTTALHPDEVVTEVLVPPIGPREGWGFQEMVRRASDFATVGVAATVSLHDDARTVRGAQVALVGVADRPVMAATEPLAALAGTTATERDLRAAAEVMAEQTDPPSDVHATGWYRKRLVAVLVARALREASARAAGGGR
ncbi:MAG: xanthine dehydrogenase family protein subunit M [Actinomycetota bacterium]|jgi:CO/xanthine dehydrogenase FAD-binding subunit|nr:xanthine dehydrogenase family protein subunit M [Actinomycetota bacterium]